MRTGWKHYFFYKTHCVKTTWTCRLALATLVVLILFLTQGLWLGMIGRALVCSPQQVRSGDAILIDNFERNYLLFERAAELRARGTAPRVLIPTEASPGSAAPNVLFAGIADLMVSISRLGDRELISVQEIEPISLNAAYQIRDFLEKEHLRSIIVVTPAFRSRRSALIYTKVFAQAGITTYCVPVFGQLTPDNWSQTWHGIQQVTEQYLKLQYYRLYVLPFRLHRATAPVGTGQSLLRRDRGTGASLAAIAQ
jgi:hypothetical protein